MYYYKYIIINPIIFKYIKRIIIFIYKSNNVNLNYIHKKPIYIHLFHIYYLRGHKIWWNLSLPNNLSFNETLLLGGYLRSLTISDTAVTTEKVDYRWIIPIATW